MENKICQSCSMPLFDENDFGKEKDGSLNKNYCSYCYKDGEFTDNMTMEEMINFCIPYVVKDTNVSEEEAKKLLEKTFPNLLRWKKDS